MNTICECLHIKILIKYKNNYCQTVGAIEGVCANKIEKFNIV